MKVTKRNGKEEEFDIRKVRQAIRKAYAEVNAKYDENVVRAVRLWIGKRDEVSVEEIQDVVEEVLMKYSEKTAKAYILYRERHRQLRETQGLFDIGQIDKYVQKDDWMVKENANMSYSLQGMNIYITSKVTSNYWLEKLYPSKVSKAHRSGDLHIHDLNMLGVYCVGWDLMDLLTVGFSGTRDKIESRPAKHFATALMHVVNFLYTLTGECAGAVAFSNFDTLMAPFVREDMLTDNEVRQELQRFIFNMNVPTRVGFQQPFSNLSVDLECPKFLKDQGAIVGGKMSGEVYGEYGVEQKLINRTLAELMCEGDAKEMPFTFPIINYSLAEGMDFEAYPEVWEMTAKYGLPYFTNYIGTDMNPDDVRSMCFLGKTKIIWRKNNTKHLTTFQHLFWHHSNQEVETIMNGKWIKAKVLKVPYEEDFYKIILRNGVEIIVTKDHLHITSEGLKDTTKLKVGDSLCFSKQQVEWEGVGSYNFGRFLGIYLAEGSHQGNGIQFSLGENETEVKNFLKEFIEENFGLHVGETENTGRSITIIVPNKTIREILSNFIDGDRAVNKKLKNWTKLSCKALKGLWDGWIEGDGSYSGECYTKSIELLEQMLIVANILGILVNKRKKWMETEFNGKQYKGWLYILHICKPNNEGGRIYYDEGHYFGVKITDIECVSNANKVAFCFEVAEEPHLFELPNGLCTHNCCRLALDKRELMKRGGGLFGSNPLTGSCGVVTLNMPRIGRIAKGDDEYMERIGELMDLAMESLEVKRKVIERLTEMGMYPYSKYYLRSVKEATGKYWTNHFSTIGLVGMNESMMRFMGKDMSDGDAIRFAGKVLEFMRGKLVGYQEETGSMYNLEATPAEGCSYSLALADKRRFGEAEVVYTNSSQLPVDFEGSFIEAIGLQEGLQQSYSGGTVMHLYLGEGSPEPSAIMELVKRVASKTKLPYFTIVPQYSICRKCGRLGGFHKVCPKCGGDEVEAYSRVVGYLRPISSWNEGKVDEFRRRKYFKIGEVEE